MIVGKIEVEEVCDERLPPWCFKAVFQMQSIMHVSVRAEVVGCKEAKRVRKEERERSEETITREFFLDWF